MELVSHRVSRILAVGTQRDGGGVTKRCERARAPQDRTSGGTESAGWLDVAGTPVRFAFDADQRRAPPIDSAVGRFAPHSAWPLYVQFSEYTPSELRSPTITRSTSASW